MLLLSLMLSPETLRACQYNVRDIGFVDLEAEAYRFYAFVRPETPADTLTLLQQVPAVALRDCNVQFELVTAGGSTTHPAFQHLPRGTDQRFPSAVLVSPDGHALPLALTHPNQPFRVTLTSALGEVASSRTREELLATASRSFAAVLLIEGEAAAANERARQAVARAIDAIRGQMASMPKPISDPPAMVVLDAAARTPERILLWSLGLDPAEIIQPRAAIVYGRARWMGPLMQGDEISEPNLTGLLAIIGADCECGLDVGWTLGTRLPVRWDDATHALVAKALGFDPESPLVKVEVSRIARRSGSPAAPATTNRAVVLSSDPRPPAGNTLAGAPRKPGAVSTPHGTVATEAVPTVDSAPVLSRAWVSVAAMAVIVLAVGLFLVWKAGRRGS